MRTAHFVRACVYAGALASSAYSSALHAAPVVEEGGRLEVNWGTHRIRFYGEAKSSDSDGAEALKAAEKKAWQDGLAYVSDAVRDLNIAANESHVSNTEALTQNAREAARQVATSTFSYNTTYFGDGTVRVHLENALPKALEVAGLRFRQKEALQTAMTQFSGIVLKCDKALKPRATYQVVDETGTVVFDVRDMAEDAFRRNLMGRWFRRPSPSELVEVVGNNPVTVAASVGSDATRLVVDRAAWEAALEGHRALLVNGTIALALP